MKVSVKLGEPLWRQVGRRTLQLEWEQPSVTVATVLRHLQTEYPGFGPAFRGAGLPAAYPYNLFVNARLVRLEQADTTPMHDGDKLYIFIPVVGG
ncbi:MAG: MoaD/ThiS family protein [Anaerolineae bacterium]|nr:MoaD/ThiS family protein [Anaerolineae bacterium]